MPTLKVTATGKAAHAGNHHADGANAIWALSKFVMRTARAHPDAVFSALRGGQARNTVPDHAEVLITASAEALRDLDLTTDIENTTLAGTVVQP